ncbi:MAG: hypothetical protein IJ065_14930 [Eubacterium sp.]|nr:hypothetical protein [Eubacterium sp.]
MRTEMTAEEIAERDRVEGYDPAYDIDETGTEDLAEDLLNHMMNRNSIVKEDEISEEDDESSMVIKIPEELYQFLENYTMVLCNNEDEFKDFIKFAVFLNRYYQTYDIGNLILIYYQRDRGTYVYPKKIWEDNGIQVNPDAKPVLIINDLKELKADRSNMSDMFLDEVFDITDTNGYLEGDTRLHFKNKADACQALIETRPCLVKKKPSTGYADNIVYDPEYDRIYASPGSGSYDNVFGGMVHEYYHAYMKKIMERIYHEEEIKVGKRGSYTYSKIDLSIYADITTYALCQLYNMEPSMELLCVKASWRTDPPAKTRVFLQLCLNIIFEIDDKLQRRIYEKRETDGIISQFKQ